MSEKTITCTACPMGCIINIIKKDEGYLFEGYQCNRGKEYASQEVKDPRRLLTTTVKISNGTQQMLPVRSNELFPKHLLREGVKSLASVSVEAPVICGEVIVHDLLNTGIDIIASRNMKRSDS